MHGQALEWVAFHARACGDPLRVLDLGGRNINGSARVFFPSSEYSTLDILPGADITADAATWIPDREYDAIVCTETFEHTPDWRAICVTAYTACRPGGTFIVTCAGPGRDPHSAVDGKTLREGEHYGNVAEPDLFEALHAAGWSRITTSTRGTDTRAVATKKEI